MDQIIRAKLDAIRSEDKEVQGEAYQALLGATNEPVSWAYEAWAELLQDLRSRDNRLRSIASQILSNLARSDPEKRMVNDLAALIEVTRDEKFVTARHCMQSLWKVGVVGESQRLALMEGLTTRFHECIEEKNCTLIRSDVLESLRKVYEVVTDPVIRERALALIETEADLKYRKKYATLWKR